MLLNYEQIRMDGGTQPRTELQKEVMEDYAELMRAGVKFPPLAVFHDGENYWLADGFHRMGAALRAFPAKPIEVEVFQGTLPEAQWYSFGVNKTHGLRRTNDDKERVVRAAMAHPNAAQLSNRQIAEHCGVSEITVRRYRDRTKSTATMSQSNSANGQPSDRSSMRKGRDGRTINTKNIGKRAKSRKTGIGRKFSRDVTTPVLGHSLPNPMINLSLSPNNPAIAAATICNLFEPTFIKTLIEELTQRIKGLVS
jgi:hypothetical protein